MWWLLLQTFLDSLDEASFTVYSQNKGYRHWARGHSDSATQMDLHGGWRSAFEGRAQFHAVLPV